MIETIGKPGVCIRQIDREEILIALDNLLDMRKKRIRKNWQWTYKEKNDKTKRYL